MVLCAKQGQGVVQVDEQAGEMMVGALVKAAEELVEKRVTCAQSVTNKNVGREKRAAEQMIMDGEQKGAPAVDQFLCHQNNEGDRIEVDDKVHTDNGGEEDNEEIIQVCSQVIVLLFNSFSRCLFGLLFRFLSEEDNIFISKGMCRDLSHSNRPISLSKVLRG